MATLEAISAEASRIVEDATYSSKSHFEAAGMWRRIHLWMGIPIAVLAALSGVSALSDKPVVAAVIAFLVAGLTGVTTFLNPEKRAAVHHATGNQYLALRNRTRIFMTLDLRLPDNAPNAITELKALATQRDELNSSSPPIPRWAFSTARSGIESGEAQYEIDSKKRR